MENYEDVYYADCLHFTVGRADQWGEQGYLLFEGRVYSYEEDRKEQTGRTYSPLTIREFLAYAEKHQIQVPEDFLEKLMEAESEIGLNVETQEHKKKSVKSADELSSQTFYHGTKADLKPGDLIEAGFSSNYGQRKKAKYIYLTATLDAAIWGCELASGEGRERIYIVEPTGEFEDDPNLTDKKFPGNPTKSYRSLHPLRVISEITDWQGHSPEQLKAMKDHLEKLKELGIEAIED